MGIKAVIFGAVSMVLILSWLATWQVGKAYLDQRDLAVELRHTNEINELTQDHKESQERALKDLATIYDHQITDQEAQHLETVNDLTHQLLTARDDAAQAPIQFGDDLIRNFIRTDCLWNKGSDANSVQGREACDREAADADPTSTGLYFAVLTPTFLRGWSDACGDWETIPATTSPFYDEELLMWNTDYGNFDVKLCNETIVAITPEASIYINRFIENGRNYSSQILSVAEERGQQIDILMERYDEPASKNIQK